MGVAARIVSLLVLLALPSVALAQSPTVDEARTLFEQGTLAVHEGRFAEARDALERSLSLSPRPATAFNLVIALRGLGELVRASEVCGSSLEASDVALASEQAAEARSVCDGVRSGIAEVNVRAAGTVPFGLRVDGVSSGELHPSETRQLTLDPGDHVLSTFVADHVAEQTLHLPAGARLSLELFAPAQGGVDTGIVVGLVVSGVAVAVVAIVAAVLATTAPAGPRADYPVVATLTTF